MLSTQEKKEILQDACCSKRRAAFRKTETASPHPSFDAYLKFLASVHKVFSHVPVSIQKSLGKNFKL